jgi:hypothetical protein
MYENQTLDLENQKVIIELEKITVHPLDDKNIIEGD